MSAEQQILINQTPFETRVALTESGELQELHVERALTRGILGNIYKGKVVRLLPGMQAAFVDIGLERNGFLHAQDFVPTRSQEKPSHKKSVPIQDLLHEGQSIYVQVTREAINDKGPRLSSELGLPSCNLVYLPNSSTIGISHKISDKAERQRLEGLVVENQNRLEIEGGFVVRTSAESLSEQNIATELSYLKNLWAIVQQSIQQLLEQNKTIGLVYQELSLAKRALRDLMTNEVRKIRIDSQQEFDQLLEFSNTLLPQCKNKIELYDLPKPLFDLHATESQIQAALESQVELKSGGNIVIEQTESMVTIDVNTASFVGAQDSHETVLQTNLEAASEIARQLRLRNLGGIIIVDFIDMQREQHKKNVLAELTTRLIKDKVATTISNISSLGLIELTRKRNRQSLEQVMCVPCVVCQGGGNVKSAQTICYEILRNVAQYEDSVKAVTIMASESVVNLLADQHSDYLDKLQRANTHTISLRVEPQYQQSQYDIIVA